MRAGTVERFAANSLAEAIEAAFAAELRASKNRTLPAVAVEERRLLFAAVAQGLLAFLSRNDSELKVNVSVGGRAIRSVTVRAPTLAATGATTVVGEGWPVGARVALTWAGSGQSAGTLTAADGGFSLSVSPPEGGDVLGARDESGNAAAVRVG
jgi:hypothetical protein